MSVAIRVIPCLDVDAGRVVKGVNFENLRDAGDPVELAQRYDAAGRRRADLPGRHGEQRRPRHDVRRGAPHGRAGLHPADGRRGRPHRSSDVDRLLRAGADKVGVNTAAIARPELIAEIADRFGSQVLVLSADVRRRRTDPAPSDDFEVTTHGGRRGTGIDAVEWCARAADLGAGEILLNSMDADGTRDGFDLQLIERSVARCRVPLIASGGAGRAGGLRAGGRGGRRRGAGGQRLPLRRADDRRGQGRAAGGGPPGPLSPARAELPRRVAPPARVPRVAPASSPARRVGGQRLRSVSWNAARRRRAPRP